MNLKKKKTTLGTQKPRLESTFKMESSGNIM
jgi:hypothetical protein